MSAHGVSERTGDSHAWREIAKARRSSRSFEAMVTSAHPSVSAEGARVLATGGNAADAALAMAAMAAVVLPALCGVGGDAFAVYFEAATSTSTAVQGSGFGPDGADRAFFAARGESTVPLFGPYAVSVPGWASAIEAIHVRFATRPLPELFARAISTARTGFALTDAVVAELAEYEAAIRADAASEAMLLGGAPARVGDRLALGDLAATLETVANDPRALYSGTLGERCVAALQRAGAPFSGEEWACQAALVGPALEGRYAGHRLFTTALPSPGYMVLQQAALLDGSLAEHGLLSAPAISLMARAAAYSFAQRFAHVGSDSGAIANLLAPAAIAEGRRELARGSTRGASSVSLEGETTSFCVVDREGNAASFIQSIGFSWGARVTIDGTGILLNNRLGRGAYLLEGHPNELAPRRRPMHTLNAWLATDATGQLRAVGNTPGGDGQVQWNLQLCSHLFDHGLDAQEVVDAPRFSVAPGSDADVIGDALSLRCESRIGTEVLDELRASGLPVVAVGPFAGGGDAQLIDVSLAQGSLSGASDSRQDGCALGL